MSSHREAPQISKDPVADNTDVYAFVSPDKADTVTLIANFVPLEDPDGGPNFFEFGDDVSYEINIDNSGDGMANVVYQFRFRSVNTIPTTFLYNVGPIESISSKNWNRKQFYDVVRYDAGKHGGGGANDIADMGHGETLGSNLASPPCNVGKFSTPNYVNLANEGIHHLPGGRTVFAGQRAEGFYVDLGAIFDLGDLRPFENLHVGGKMPQSGRNSTKGKNIHSIVLQVPKSDLTSNGQNPTNPTNPASTVGVWAIARRQKVRLLEGSSDSSNINTGPFVQVSRLANPLVNEVLIPIGRKDFFNSQPPANDSQFAQYFAHPELAQLLPVLYPGAFPNLADLNKSGKPRADLEAIFLTGLPAGIVPGFQNTTGTHQSELLRLNMAIPPTTSKPSNLGLIGMDAAGFPNGRRVFDDVTTIELRALAGATYPLVDKSFTPDKAAGAITPGLTSSNTDVTAKNTVHYLPHFPYLGTPHAGYDAPADDDTPFPVTSY